MSDRPRVALLIESSRSYGRGLLRGIKRYISQHGPWTVFLERRDLQSPVPTWLKTWRGDGILARTDTRRMADAIYKTNAAVVELRSAGFLKHGAGQVTLDNHAAGRLGAEYFLNHGLRRFGWYSLDTKRYGAYDERRDGFIGRLAMAGFTCSELHSTTSRFECTTDWEKQQRELVAWVRALPKPIGILAASDQLGFWLLEACSQSGISVPEEVAVVGSENDEFLCSMATPTLSSISCNDEQVGYRAAALLADLMRGQSPPEEPIRIAPVGVVTRQSSDVMAIDDPDVCAAVRYIREHAREGIGVEDVLQEMCWSRSTLERRIRAALGRSPKAEILRVQLEAVKELLQQTELPLAAIAERVGFSNPQHMGHMFRKRFRQTPGDYRLQTRSHV